MTDLVSRYAIAEQMITVNQKKLIHRPMVAPVWIRDTETFVYRNRNADGADFVFVDAATGEKRPAFDHERVAKALSVLLDGEYTGHALPFFFFEPREDNTIRFAVGTDRIEVDLETYEAKKLGDVVPAEAVSPDGKWAISRRDHNLFIRDTETDAVRQLTTDGEADLTYAISPGGARNQVTQDNIGFVIPPQIVWAPDSSKFVTYRLDERRCSQMHLVRSAPLDGSRPQVYTYRYGMVGDEHVATAEYVVFDAASGAATKAQCDPVLMPYVSAVMLGFVWWSDDASKVYFIAADRGDKNVWVNELDPATGDVRLVIHEANERQVLLGPQLSDRFVRVLATGEIVIWSERSGWGHLYLVSADGEWKALTSGEWLVRKLVAVDETARRVVFTAGGVDPAADPYIQQLYSVSLDTAGNGNDLTAITDDGLDHECFPSKSGRFFVDNTSRVDVPNVAVLRNLAGDVVLELETADATALFATGFTPCERVAVKGHDGRDMWCGIYKPIGFDETKSYPVLDEIYPGPQINTVPMRFPQSGGVMTGAPRAFEMLALGFVVVMVDGRGSALRSQEYYDDARTNGRGNNIVDDHVSAIKQLAATRPWMDLDRVGVYGHSGGGYASVRCMLKEPDFFKVCVSSAGDHDDHTYHSWWGEKYFGLEDEHDYAVGTNASLAANLKGKLLLAHGEMDDNVTPHLTMRLVDALIKENKNFDLKIVPNADHSMFHNLAWWSRQRWDYFVTHLLHETPPEYRVADIAFDAEMLAAMMGGAPRV